MKKPLSNVAASVHDRLLNRAKTESRPFNELLQYYVMERFLYRLSRSNHADRFVLKGALMLQCWDGPLTRATKDVDLLGLRTAPANELIDMVRACIAVTVEDDGLRFDPATVAAEAIRLDAHYDGTRIRCRANLGNARIHMQIDVGFGDIVIPGAQHIVYPTLLDFDAPRLLGYTPETVIAEKFEAMVVLDMANTRLKDFLDIWILIQGQAFSGAVVAEAIDATFRRRRTSLPPSTPIALTPAFHSAPAKQAQWRAYIRKARVQGEAPSLDQVARTVETFVTPVVNSLLARRSFTLRWPPAGPWFAESGGSSSATGTTVGKSVSD